jgi:uncharacterized membrane protein
MTVAITFFEVVNFVHVAAVVSAWGVIFAYPILQRAAERQDPRAVPYFWHTAGRIGTAIIAPGSVLILATGIVMVVDQEAFGFGDLWVTAGLIAIIVLMAFGPLFFTPTERRLAAAAERDIAAAGTSEVQLGDDYRMLARRYLLVGRLNVMIVLVAIFFMVVKP